MEQLKERKVFSLSIRQQDPRTMLLLTDKTCNSKSCFGLIGGVQCAAHYRLGRNLQLQHSKQLSESF